MANKKQWYSDIRRTKGQLGGRTIKEAYELWRTRAANRHWPEPLSVMQGVALWSTIPLGVSEWCMPVPDKYKRVREWLKDAATKFNSRVDRCNMGQYSKRCRYSKIRHVQRVASRGCVVADCLYFRIDTPSGIKTGLLKPGKGWRFGRDENGIVLLGPNGEDYHPTANELVSNSCNSGMSLPKRLKWLKNQARSNLATRKFQDKQQRELLKTRKQREAALKAAAKDGVQVCMQDSLRAGNCQAGTLNWIRNSNLRHNKHYSLATVLKAGADNDRVKRVAFYAIERHTREMARGYSELADHIVDFNGAVSA